MDGLPLLPYFHLPWTARGLIAATDARRTAPPQATGGESPLESEKFGYNFSEHHHQPVAPWFDNLSEFMDFPFPLRPSEAWVVGS